MADTIPKTQLEPVTIIKEGKAQVGFHGEVFYNPVQEFNRDLTVSVLRQFVKERIKESECVGEQLGSEPSKKKKKIQENEGVSIRILDALSASGLRALRFSKEVPNVSFIMANDFSENAVESIKENIKLNDVENIVQAHFGDAIMTMMNHRNMDKRFHAVDLDPYGSASVFLDSSVQCVADKVDSHANRYTRYIEPLLSIAVDFYVRIFVRVHTGAAKAKDSGTNIANVFVCSGCHAYEVVPLLRKVPTQKGQKYSTAVFKQTIMGSDNKCSHCNHPVHQAGPIYTGPIHNKEFVSNILTSLRETPEEERLGTHNRLLGVLTTVTEELVTPLYYEYDQLSNVAKCSVPKSVVFRSAILNAGYQVSGSHCNPRALKTDAPSHFLWDVIRTIAKSANVTANKHDEHAPGRQILNKAITNEINFALHPKATSQTKTDQMVRFQCNKGKNWGPRQKAKGSVNSVQAGFQNSAQTVINE